VGSWGWAIALMTITVRTLLFPLSISQIKSSAAMRRLKPEMDDLNARYKDDPAQRGLALQELWRKHGVTNPVLGCIPVLLQMPVWFALYQALQTAVELYHVPFLSARIIPDLSDKGEYFVIPAILGASSFFQQKLMPPQGDPMQQKMMQYMLPGIFVVMMLYLPAGLGVYMLTNTWLGIAQQVAVERYLSRKTQGSAGIEVREKPEKSSGDETKSAPALGKGKARVRG
jgi:YidC/Oxa1 family membrane protein insertase